MNKTSVSTLLTCMSAIGVVATAVLTAKATPKASTLIEDAERKKDRALTKLEKVKEAAPAYIPAIVTGISTIACIFGANVLNKKSQASFASAYALLDASYKEYQDRVRELCGEEVDYQIKEDMVKDSYYDQGFVVPEGEHLFYDLNSLQYFTASLEDVIQKLHSLGLDLKREED